MLFQERVTAGCLLLIKTWIYKSKYENEVRSYMSMMKRISENRTRRKVHKRIQPPEMSSYRIRTEQLQ